jgi:hypothetical protein
MCSTAALCMCVAMVGKNASADLRSLVGSVMLVASNAHERVKIKSGNQVASVADIIKHMDLNGFLKHVALHEYIICEEGCTEMVKTSTGHEEPASCLISRSLLAQCLASHDSNEGVVAAVLTCNGHSVSISSKQNEYSWFDSGPSFLMVGMNATEFDEKLNEFVVGQCDVTVIYSICANQTPHIQSTKKNTS